MTCLIHEIRLMLCFYKTGKPNIYNLLNIAVSISYISTVCNACCSRMILNLVFEGYAHLSK